MQLVSLLMWLLENSLLRLWLSVSGICNQLLSESPVRCSKTLWEERAYSSKSLILLKLFHFLISNLIVALCSDKKKKPTVSRVTAIQGSRSGIILLWMVLHVAHITSLQGRAGLKKCMFLSGVVNIYQESKVTVSGCLFSHTGEFPGVFSTGGKVTTQSHMVPVRGSFQPVCLDPFVG